MERAHRIMVLVVFVSTGTTIALGLPADPAVPSRSGQTAVATRVAYVVCSSDKPAHPLRSSPDGIVPWRHCNVPRCRMGYNSG